MTGPAAYWHGIVCYFLVLGINLCIKTTVNKQRYGCAIFRVGKASSVRQVRGDHLRQLETLIRHCSHFNSFPNMDCNAIMVTEWHVSGPSSGKSCWAIDQDVRLAIPNSSLLNGSRTNSGQIIVTQGFPCSDKKLTVAADLAPGVSPSPKHCGLVQRV